MSTWSNRFKTLLRTTTFQLTLSYSLLFGVSVIMLSLFFYWSTLGLLVRETDATLKAEITGLAEQYIEHGLDRLAQVIVHRIRTDPSGDMLYLLASRTNEPLTGNLLAWPEGHTDSEGWIEFEQRSASGRLLRARGRIYLLRDGLRVVVARNIEQMQRIEAVVNRALLGGGGLIVVLATVGGLFMSNRLLRRVTQFSEATGDIVAGKLDRRLPASGSGDEFDILAQHVNVMLDRLQALLAAVRHVSDNIAHDLRTPLTRLRNRIELAARAAPPELQTELERSVAEADALLATFASLLNIARIESGTYSAERTALDLSRLVEDGIELYLGLAQEKALVIVPEISPAMMVEGDRNLLFQAVANLLDNAIKYAPGGGAIGVSLRVESGRAIIEVRDAGPGIPREDYERVTQRFARLDRSRSLPGAGLGLSLVKAVAELHGGELRFADNAPGLRAIMILPTSNEVKDSGPGDATPIVV